MINNPSVLAEQRVKEWFIHDQITKESERRDASPKVVPERAIITISREYGAGGHSVATLVSEGLGEDWQIWDREIVDAVAKNARVRKEMVECLDERMHSLMEQLLRYTTNYYALDPDRYHKHLIEVMLSIAHQGKKIIIGRGANFILKQALRVRLLASDDYRISMIKEHEGVSHSEAVAKLRKTDAERSEFIRSMFGKNLNDESCYDLIIRMDNISVETAASMIVAGIKHHMNEPIRAHAPLKKNSMFHFVQK